MRPSGFDFALAKRLVRPRQPLHYQSFISAAAPESVRIEEKLGGPGPLQLPYHKINQHLCAATITAADLHNPSEQQIEFQSLFGDLAPTCTTILFDTYYCCSVCLQRAAL